MQIAIAREPTAYSSQLMLVGVVLAGSQPMLARLLHGCTAMAFTASVPADQPSHRLAHTIKGGERPATLHWR